MTDTNTQAAPKTTRELLAIAEARVATLKQRLVTEQVLESIQPGMNVEFRFGRAAEAKTDEAGNVTQEAREARILVGEVVAVRDAKGPKDSTFKQVRIRSGEGFDEEFFNVPAKAITKIGDAATGSTEADEAEEAGDAADPLANA